MKTRPVHERRSRGKRVVHIMRKPALDTFVLDYWRHARYTEEGRGEKRRGRKRETHKTSINASVSRKIDT
jgi:hypothetical protein